MRKCALKPVQVCQKHHPCLIVLRRRSKDMPRQRHGRRKQLPDSAQHLPHPAQSTPAKRPEQSHRRSQAAHRYALPVAQNQSVIVEIIARIHPHALPEAGAASKSSRLRIEQRILMPSIFFRVRVDDTRGNSPSQRQSKLRPNNPSSAGSNIGPSQCRITGSSYLGQHLRVNRRIVVRRRGPPPQELGSPSE